MLDLGCMLDLLYRRVVGEKQDKRFIITLQTVKISIFFLMSNTINWSSSGVYDFTRPALYCLFFCSCVVVQSLEKIQACYLYNTGTSIVLPRYISVFFDICLCVIYAICHLRSRNRVFRKTDWNLKYLPWLGGCCFVFGSFFTTFATSQNR